MLHVGQRKTDWIPGDAVLCIICSWPGTRWDKICFGYSAFSTPAQEAEQRGNGASYGIVYVSCCTGAAQRGRAGTEQMQAQDWATKYHTQTADVNLNNLWNVNVAFFFPLKDQRPYLPRIKQSWGENNKFQWEMDVKTDEGGSEGLKNTTLAEGKVSQMVGKRLGFHWKGFNSCESEKDAVILSDMESVPGERN